MSEMAIPHILLIEDNPGDVRLVELMLAEPDINRFQVTNHTDTAITSAIISLSLELGNNVVAEGVETQQQLDYLCRQRADEIQGYYISHPLPAEALSNLVISGSYRSIIEKVNAA